MKQDIKLDLQRAERLGFDEAVFCGPKSATHLIHILEEASHSNLRLLLTRLSNNRFSELPEKSKSVAESALSWSRSSRAKSA